MSYPKSNLGAIVLPCNTDGSLTLEEYKEKFGIDLLDIFFVSGLHIYPREGDSKPLYFMGSDGRVLAYNFTKTWNDEAGTSDVYGGAIFTEDNGTTIVDAVYGLVFKNAESVELWEF